MTCGSFKNHITNKGNKMQEDIDHIAGTLFYSYTNVPPGDIMEIIDVMGGEGRAGVWLEGNCPAAGFFGVDWSLDFPTLEKLQADAKLSNKELLERYRKPLGSLIKDLVLLEDNVNLLDVTQNARRSLELPGFSEWWGPTPIDAGLTQFIIEFAKILEDDPKLLEALTLAVDTKLNVYHPADSRPPLAELASSCLSERHAVWFLDWASGLPTTALNDQVILPLLLLEVVELERSNKDSDLTQWEPDFVARVLAGRCATATETAGFAIGADLRRRMLKTWIPSSD